MDTLSKLYLGSEPAGVRVEDDQLLVTLADGRTASIPLQVVSQLQQTDRLPAEVEVLILRHPPRVDHVRVTDSALNVYLKDGRLVSCPLAWFPRLLHGTPAERNHYELSGDDNVIHWPELDEDIEVTRLLEGGKSVESERSIQRWLLSRQVQAETKAGTD
jgi:hypothetical protein